MTVLVTGATGTVGSGVVADLIAHGVTVRALTRSPDANRLPAAVEVAAGTLSDPDSVRAALVGVEGVFLLSAVASDELAGTLAALSLIHRAGVKAITYLSVIHADRFTDPSHFAAKGAAERMIADFGIPATILRPGYYIQNDIAERRAIIERGRYEPPVGNAGMLMTDVRDLAEVGSATLRQRLASSEHLPARVIDVVAPTTVTGDWIAGQWAQALGRDITYGGDDFDRFEHEMRARSMPPWMAHDMRLMMRRFAVNGMVAAPGTDEALLALLGRPMRSYSDFIREAAAAWTVG